MNDIAFASDLDHLRHCEKIVMRGMKTCWDVGVALREIQELHLWKHAEQPVGEAAYANFDDYCQRVFQFGKSYASRLISGAKVAESLPIGNKLNESQVRELRKIPEDQRADVLEWAKEKSGRDDPPAKVIREAAEEYASQDTDGDEPEDDEPEDDYDLEVEATPEDYEDIGAAPETDAEDLAKANSDYADLCTALADEAEEIAKDLGNHTRMADFIGTIKEMVRMRPIRATDQLETIETILRNSGAA